MYKHRFLHTKHFVIWQAIAKLFESCFAEVLMVMVEELERNFTDFKTDNNVTSRHLVMPDSVNYDKLWKEFMNGV